MHAADIASPAEYARNWPHSVHGQDGQPVTTRLYQARCRDDATATSYGWAEYLYMAVVRQAASEAARQEGTR